MSGVGGLALLSIPLKEVETLLSPLHSGCESRCGLLPRALFPPHIPICTKGSGQPKPLLQMS